MRVILRGYIAVWLNELKLRYWDCKLPEHEEITLRYKYLRLYHE
jgi:hypothetical protein